MTKGQKWFVLICLLLGLGGGSLIAQLQQSGGPGSSVSISAALPNGTNTIGNVKVTDGTNFQPTGDSAARTIHVTTDNASQAVTESGTWNVGLNAGTNIIGKTVPITACGATVYSQALVAVPTSATVATSTTTCVYALVFNNTNASAQTVTVTDNQGSPVTAINAFSIPANSNVTFPFYGTQFTSGIKWNAGGTGVTGSIVGVQ